MSGSATFDDVWTKILGVFAQVGFDQTEVGRVECATSVDVTQGFPWWAGSERTQAHRDAMEECSDWLLAQPITFTEGEPSAVVQCSWVSATARETRSPRSLLRTIARHVEPRATSPARASRAALIP